MQNRINHWNNIYNNKTENQVSWTQRKPTLALELLAETNVQKDAQIIDVGCGQSYFPDHLINLGYENITLLDISETAIQNSKNRLKDTANLTYVISDVTEFKPSTAYDFWYDRAVFHFLTNEEEIKKYIALAASAINPKGFLLLGTFSKEGPLKCSGLNITQYDESSMSDLFNEFFQPVKFVSHNHKTPFDTEQAFIFGLLQRK